jgi:predicted TIM-barrel fold metal-dependent hydrolase
MPAQAILPAVIVDMHAHLEPRMLDLDAVVAKMDAAGVHRVALIPALNDPLPETPERLLAAMRVLMRSRATRPLAELVHRATLTRGGDLRLGRAVHAIYPRPDNAAVAAAVARHPDRFLGWIFLNPRAETSPRDALERWRAVPGMVGIKLHPHWHDYRTDVLDPILARAEALRMPVLIHLGFRARGDYRAIAARFPRLVVIAAHAGFPFYDDLWRHAGDCPNLHVDLSSPYIDERLARAAVAAMGPARCLYGTDAPYGFHDADGTYDYGEIKRWVERLAVSSAEREAILGGNFARILDAAR